MAPDKKAADSRKTNLNLTPRECELLAAAWVASQDPQIDWDKFASLAGFKNAHSARTSFGPLKKKLHDTYGSAKTAAGVVKPYQWTPRRKGKRNAADAGEMADPAGEDPASTSAGNKAPKNVIDLDGSENEADAAAAAAAKQAKRQKVIAYANASDAVEIEDTEGLV